MTRCSASVTLTFLNKKPAQRSQDAIRKPHLVIIAIFVIGCFWLVSMLVYNSLAGSLLSILFINADKLLGGVVTCTVCVLSDPCELFRN